MPNLIVIMFNLMYYVFYLGFICKGCVWERKSVKTQGNWRQKLFSRHLASKPLAKWSTCLAHDWNAKNQDRMKTVSFCECHAGKAFPRVFCFTELSYLIHTFYTHTIHTPITHICWGVLLRENPSHNHWELEIVIPTILYISLWIFLNSYLSISIHLRGW